MLIVRIALLASLTSVAMFGDLIPEVRAAIGQNQTPVAQRMIEAYQKQRGATPELIEAMSWLARAGVAEKRFDEADKRAQEVLRLASAQLAKQAGRLDAEPHLPVAVGAAIEVEAQAMAGRGERDQAVVYLRNQLRLYYATSIRTRIQKNINLMSLEGKPMPPLESAEFLGPKPPPAETLRGKPVLLVFWAHWCGDCRAEVPAIAKLKNEYAPKGLVVLAPTQHYGYVSGGDDAPRAVETKYIAEIRAKFYAGLADVPMPLSEENFKRYGSSTTPTLVLVDRAGIVRMYHPGAMSEDELRARLDSVAKR
jgi:thiol-disulfide isomerase/thioredoxin